MVEMRQLNRRVALGLIAGGGVLAVLDTTGFSSVIGDRDMGLAVSDDDSALVALVEANYSHIPNNEFETVAYLTNNLSTDAIVDYEISTNQDGVSIRFAGEEGEPGDSLSGENLLLSDPIEIELECSIPGQIDENEILTVEIPYAESDGVTIQDITMNLPFVCDSDGASLEIDNVRGLESYAFDHEYSAEIDVTETENVWTDNLEVTLTVTGDSTGVVFDAAKQAPDDIDNIRGETATVFFDEMGSFDIDDYEYTVTADADTAAEVVHSDTFIVAEIAPPNLTVVWSDNEPTNSDLTFDVENEGEDDAVIEAISWDSTTHRHATYIQRSGNEFVRNDGAGSLDGEITLDGPSVELDETAVIPPAETASFTLGQFRRSDNNNTTNMNNESATITLSLTDWPDQELVIEG